MKITLFLNKTIEQNAEVYFDKSKKLKKKTPGIRQTLELQREKLAHVEEELASIQNAPKIVEKIKKEWYEKFRWFISSDDLLVIGGRDATSNEIVIKKHTDPADSVFHTEEAGSPFVVIKNPEKIDIPPTTVQEAAIFCGSFSRQWRAGRTTAEVFHIAPDQVSKEAPAGLAALPKGSFMIYGRRVFHSVSLNLAMCMYHGKIMTGPLSAVKKHSDVYIELIQGNSKVSDLAKKIKARIGGELDDIIRNLPSECAIKK